MEPIEILALFSNGIVRPIAYKLNGIKHKVKEMTANYSYYEGREKVFNIVVIGDDDKMLELTYWPEYNSWRIKR